MLVRLLQEAAFCKAGGFFADYSPLKPISTYSKGFVFIKYSFMAKNKLKSILGDGIALAVPLAVVLYVFGKIIAVIQKAISPVAGKYGIDTFLGDITLTVLALLVLLLLILALGLFMQFPVVTKIRDSIEEIILRFIPSLNQLKTVLAERFDREHATSFWKPVLLEQSDTYGFAFLVEESAEIGVFFKLEGNSFHEGKTKILKRKHYTYTHVEPAEMRKCLKQYGIGSTELIDRLKTK
jgi:hypothetical protein